MRNKLFVIIFAVYSLIAAQNLALAQADMAVANEVLINTNLLHGKVAEKYLEAATDDKNAKITDWSETAVTLSLPYYTGIPKDSVITADLMERACREFHSYIRSLRHKNAEGRKSSSTPKLIYNFQCDPNAILYASAIPNDPSFGQLWGLNNSQQNNNIDMDLPEAWDKTTGSQEVVVAVIDTGIDYNHPDLAANMWKNLAELNGLPDKDDDNNGVIDDIYGYNATNNTGDPKDDNKHGTHCAGTIGAVGNNSIGVVGVNHKVKLMAAKFLTANGSGTLEDAVKAINYVTDQKRNGINIVASNNSWGGGGYYSTLVDAINRAGSYDILFVAAAGNSGQNIDNAPSYPASYTLENIISVGAIDKNGALASFSNYGTTSVDIVAPGVDISSTTPDNTYYSLSGTSMATPHISGAIALLKSYASSMNMSTLKDILFSTGKQINAAVGKTKYGKIPSAYEMLLEADRRGLGNNPPAPAPIPAPRPTMTPTPTATPTVTPTMTPTVAPGYWNISGTINSGGKNLALAKIKLNINGQILTSYSDAQGRYTFYNVYGPGSYAIEVQSAGQQFEVKSGTLTNNTAINFSGTTKYYKLTAKIINQSGQPVPGVVVGEASSGAKLSDANGLVSFDLPYGQEYNISTDTSSADFLDSELKGTIMGDVTRVFVVLP